MSQARSSRAPFTITSGPLRLCEPRLASQSHGRAPIIYFDFVYYLLSKTLDVVPKPHDFAIQRIFNLDNANPFCTPPNFGGQPPNGRFSQFQACTQRSALRGKVRACCRQL